MRPVIKTAEEIEKMRIAGKLAADVLDMISPFVVKGVTTEELNQKCHDFIVNDQDAIPAPLNYHGFPKSICTSVNEVVCHGIPNHKKLRNGDIINIDITVIKDGYHGDTSKMFVVGDTAPLHKALVKNAQESLYLGIELVKPGIKLGAIGEAIQKHAEKQGFSVVREYCGHGIGAQFHEEPQVLHYASKSDPNAALILEAGMCFTIEPMINLGKRQTKLDKKDGWTVYTKDGRHSAQWEHTLLVTENGCEILTRRDEETIPSSFSHS